PRPRRRARGPAMTTRTLILHGERYLTLAGIAELYALDPTWILEVYDYGLLGEGEHVGDEIAVAERLLDRVATIERLHRTHGANVPGIALILDLLERESP